MKLLSRVRLFATPPSGYSVTYAGTPGPTRTMSTAVGRGSHVGRNSRRVNGFRASAHTAHMAHPAHTRRTLRTPAHSAHTRSIDRNLDQRRGRQPRRGRAGSALRGAPGQGRRAAGATGATAGWIGRLQRAGSPQHADTQGLARGLSSKVDAGRYGRLDRLIDRIPRSR